MRKRKISALLTALAVLLSSLVLVPVQAAQLPAGDGTQSSPYRITTIDELSFVADFPEAYYRLENDLTLPSTWHALDIRFSGLFDGNGYRISLASPVSASRGGLLFYGNSGTIRNLIVSGQITVRNSRPSQLESSLLCDYNGETGVIENCVAEGSLTFSRTKGVSGAFYAGGLVTTNSGTIRNCYSRVDIAYSYPTSDTTQSYSAYVGGIAGYTRGGEISNCYYAGSFDGRRGLYPITYRSSSATDAVFSGNFHDKDLTGYDSINTITTPKSSLAMTMRQTYADWDFVSDWRMAESVNDGYPFLAMERRYAAELTGLSLSESALSLAVGETAVLTPVFDPPHASQQSVLWRSEDPSVVSVQNGVVTALSAGATAVVVQSEDGAFSASCAVTVTEPTTVPPTTEPPTTEPPTTVPPTTAPPVTEPSADAAFTFRLEDDGTLAITGYTGSDTAVVIPDRIGGVLVTEIDSQAFANQQNITSVLIPASVTDIESDAFLFCSSLAAFSVDPANRFYSTDENGVLFNQNKTELVLMPAGAALTSYAIPSGVTEIDSHAFFFCAGLTSVAFPQTLREIGDYAFYGCSGIGEAFLPDGLREVGEFAFGSCSTLQEISLPVSLQQIDDGAFMGCDALATVYYAGTDPQWNAVTIGIDNDCLLRANRVNRNPPVTDPSTQPTTEPTTAPTTAPTTQPTTQPTTGVPEPSGTQPQPAYTLGDVNGDGNVTSADARLTLRAAVGLEKLSITQSLAADADRDDHIRSSDARLILRVAVGLDRFA